MEILPVQELFEGRAFGEHGEVFPGKSFADHFRLQIRHAFDLQGMAAVKYRRHVRRVQRTGVLYW